MPKARPTQVIVHRIELQEKERDLLEAAVAGKVVRDVALPVAAGAGVYVAYKAAKAAYGWTEDILDKINIKENVGEQWESIKAGEGDKHTNIFGLPGWGIWPGVL